mgnify:CR=1 FL=1|tara:strand:+ start:210 stop:1085 length:876 start_codon:yes stop_codon:yes gene_type:complete
MEKNNLFISTTFVSDGLPLSKALEICSKNNIVSLEIGSNHIYEPDITYINSFNFNFLVHNYFPVPKIGLVVNIASLDEEIRKRSISHIKKAIDFSESLGSELYTFHPGFILDPLSSNISDKNYDFEWEQNNNLHFHKDLAKQHMYSSLDEIIKYSSNFSVKIAIETEGSLSKKDYLLMQTPVDYEEFVSKYQPSDIGINLNIGHLALASRAFNFSKRNFLDIIEKYIVAMELSHNNFLEDEHLPLVFDGWYWPLIFDFRFNTAIKILEYRNTDITDVLSSIDLFRKIENDF